MYPRYQCVFASRRPYIASRRPYIASRRPLIGIEAFGIDTSYDTKDLSLTSLIVRLWALWAICTLKAQRVKTNLSAQCAFCQLASQSINKAAGPHWPSRVRWCYRQAMVSSTWTPRQPVTVQHGNGPGGKPTSPHWRGPNWTALYKDIQILA